MGPRLLFDYFGRRVWFNQLLNLIQPQTIMLTGPLWAAAINYNVCTGVRKESKAVRPEVVVVSSYAVYFFILVTKALYRRTMCRMFFH